MVYVDDIIIKDNNLIEIKQFFKQLVVPFSTKDLKTLSYFLGPETMFTFFGLFQYQKKYI